MKKNNLIIFILLCLVCPTVSSGQDGWTPLFNGKNLKGWKQLNGTATYAVKDGQIVGSTVLGSPNSFLCTTKDYADFILEFEVWVDPALNSGVQIRSHSNKEYLNGRVFGYQVEIDPSDRGWSAGIYDESRRAWLYPLTDNFPAQKAFKRDGWNHYHVEAIGNSLRTWINKIPAAKLIDNVDASGFIGLQVHGVGNDPTKAGIQVKWKNIRIMTTDLDHNRWVMPPSVKEISAIPNTLTLQEKQEGWKLLWDGKTTTGWRGADKPAFPDKGWEIKDGLLTVLESGGAESQQGGDIITIDKYSDFDLTLDFMLTEGANSGIKYFVTEGLNQGTGSAIGLEYQLLDDKIHPDAQQGVGGNRTLASLYDLIPALPDKTVNPPGSWNQARIISKGNHVEHWLNNKKVVEYERNTQMFNALVQKSKYAVYPDFGSVPEGYILLQDHGNRVSFRNIKIKKLS